MRVLSHQAERGLVLDIRKERFVVRFSGVLRGPDLGRADHILVPKLLLIRPGEGVAGQRGETEVGVARGGGP